jgi:hypothetical protein
VQDKTETTNIGEIASDVLEKISKSGYTDPIIKALKEAVLNTLEEAANECERYYYDLDEPASYLQCASSIRALGKKLT